MFGAFGRYFNMRHSHCRVQVLKSSSDTVGSFLTNATMLQISWSGTSMAPKLGIPVMLMPFLITQNNSCGEVSLASSLSPSFRPRPTETIHLFVSLGRLAPAAVKHRDCRADLRGFEHQQISARPVQQTKPQKRYDGVWRVGGVDRK
jgi:hypothetical protein